MTFLILGKGWVGTMFYHSLIAQGYEAELSDININYLPLIEHDVVVNFAASTNIDWCEKNKRGAYKNNVMGAVHIALKCKEAGAKHVFISTACIFESKDQEDVKVETSIATPKCFYTQTKSMAENLIAEIDPAALIVRPRLFISSTPHPKNTLNKLLTYPRLVTSQESVTIIEDFMPRLLKYIKEDARGIFNLVNEGTISPAEIGILMGHSFEPFSKADLDEYIRSEHRAPRVTTVVGSVKTPLLPNIKERIVEILHDYNHRRPVP